MEAARPRSEGNFVRARARAASGLHRRALRRRSRRDARRDDSAWRQSGSCQPAATRRAGDRSFRASRLLRPRRRISIERRARVRTKPRALFVPALGPGGVPQFPRRAARYRHRASSEHRVPRARRVPRGRRRPRTCLPGHARRNRLPHDHGERPRRARLGRRAVSKPRRRCSASRCRCSYLRWWGSG